MPGVLMSIVEGVAVTLLVAGLAWIGRLVFNLHRWMKNQIEPRTRQLERNHGTHLADAVYDMVDRFDRHLELSQRDHTQLIRTTARLDAHLLNHEEPRQ